MKKLISQSVLFVLGAAFFCITALPAHAQQSRTVTGKVVDEKGEVLIGAGIVSKDGKRGTLTDVDGTWSFSALDSDEVLIFSFMGYASQEVSIKGKDKVDVIMLPDTSNPLNDVVVIGYGTTKKQDLTGSVATVKMSDIADSPVVSVDQALQGRIAGMDVMSTSGDPSASTSIRIRGTRSIEASNEPLLVVDGVMDAVSDIGDINPDDIESISVMKDASSTAIYGSRGANGVIIITTKKGITDKPTVRLKASFGVSQISKKLDLMNAEEFLRYRNDYYWFRGDQDPAMTAIKDISKYPNDVDWVKAITRLAPYQNYQFTVSGNKDGNNYYGSLSFVDNKGIIINTGEKRVTGRFNFSKDFNSWLNAGLKAYTSYRKSDLNKAGIGGTKTNDGAMYLPPITGLLDIHNPLYEEGSLINTPYASSIYEDYYKDSWINTISLDATAKATRHLTIKTQNTLYTAHGHSYHFWPNTLPKRRPEEGADALKHEYEQVRFTSENTVTYKRRFNRYHNFDAMAGYSINIQTNKNTDVKARGLILDELKWNNLNGISSKENYDVNSSCYEILRQSFFGRINYNFKSRYYFTATLRADGSSNFAANRKWGFFPSAAFKWNIKKEPFMKKAKWLDALDLRASAGRTGNDAIAAYRSLQAYESTTDGYIFNGSQGVSYYPSRLENPNLTWEKTDQYSIALESSFLKNRIKLELEGYYSRTTDLLLSVQTIASTGYTSRFQNLGLTSNKGVELSIETHNIEREKFGWTTTFTISRNVQMVEDIGAEEYLSKINAPVSGLMMYGYKAGYPLNALWGLVDAGCFHNTAEVAANQDPSSPDYHKYICYGSTAEPGLQRVIDQNRDGSVGMDDVVYLGQADPEFYGGLQNNFNIGRLKLGIFFNYSVGGAIYNYSELYMGGSYRSNQYRYMLDSWHPLRNPNSDTPRAGGSQVMLPSSRFVHDASYLRLKEVNLQYTFDFKKKKSNPVVKSLTLGLSGTNLYLWSNYNGFDPDVSSESDDSTLRRVDMDAYPSSRKVVLNVQLKF
ncbi:MAG: TonB-dependent receptor [Bacteroidales bacterium]|nr:TonB-dependent receptor [Bacteroidales bacterium]